MKVVKSGQICYMVSVVKSSLPLYGPGSNDYCTVQL